MAERRCDGCRYWQFGQAVAGGPMPGAQGACTRFGYALSDAVQPQHAVDVDGWETTRAYIALPFVTQGVALFITTSDFFCAQFEAVLADG